MIVCAGGMRGGGAAGRMLRPQAAASARMLLPRLGGVLRRGTALRRLSTSAGSVLDGHVDVSSASFLEGMAHMDGLLATLRSTTATAMEGGGARATALHASRGKLLPRQRIEALLDPGAPFLERD